MFAAWSPCAAACLLVATLAATAGVPGEARTPGAMQASLHRAVRAVATLVFVRLARLPWPAQHTDWR